MNLVKLVDKMIHCVPIVPNKLQGTWLDRLWDRIETLSGKGGSEQLVSFSPRQSRSA
ncbi:MAG: hypothetical protein NWE83_04620 [Candidatus Bathyarchaeota archaeon]|nr:hypothetical protein [Candidatus Bathyarchaeota archaeon]